MGPGEIVPPSLGVTQIGQNWPKYGVLCAKKGHWLAKSTPLPLVVVVTNMSYEQEQLGLGQPFIALAIQLNVRYD